VNSRLQAFSVASAAAPCCLRFKASQIGDGPNSMIRCENSVQISAQRGPWAADRL
jgi:hypothetical protein